MKTARSAAVESPDVFVRGDDREIADRLLAALRERGETVFSEGRFWRYAPKQGVFEALEESTLSQAVQAFAGAPVKGGRDRTLRINAGTVRGAIALARDNADNPGFFAGATPGIAFVDGFLRVRDANLGLEWCEHSPGHRARFAFPFENEDCEEPPPLLTRFLREIFPGPDGEEKTRFVREYVGLSLLGLAAKFQRAVFFVGEGQNGKSTLAEFIQACFPAGSVSAVAPQDFGDQYRRAELSGKLLNVAEDISDADLKDSGSWKRVVGGQLTDARQIRQQPFNYQPVAGHICTANRLPLTQDTSRGFWRRPVVVPFERTFTDNEKAVGLGVKLRKEVATAISWFLTGADDALKRGDLLPPSSHSEALEAWQRNADPVKLFVAERCEALPEHAPNSDRTPAGKLYSAFAAWAKKNGHKDIPASNVFGERLRSIGFAAKHTKSGNVYLLRLKPAEQLW